MRPRWFIPAAILGLLATAPARAQSTKPVVVENIRVGFSETFKIGAWTPIWVQARAAIEPFDGTMEVIVDDESGTPTVFRQDVHIGAGDTARLPAYVRTGSYRGELSVRFVDREGKVKGGVELDKLNPNNQPRPIFSDEVVVLALGKPQGVELLPSLPGLNGNRAAPGAPNSGTSVVEVLRMQSLDGGFLPGRAIGYNSLDAVVVDTNDRELMAALAVQGDALKQWVEQGGHLIVAVGRNWQVARDSILGPILPATPNGTVRINDIGTIEAFAGGGSSQLAGDNANLTIPKLEGADERGAKVLCSTATSPIVVRGARGFGRVTLVALDVDQPPFSTWENRAQFWSRVIDLRPTGSTLGATPNNRFARFGINDLSTQLKVSLDQFPGVKLIPFGWVAFFIFIYILLIGPGDYFFLRKVLKRMELTWITFPAIVLLVSGVAYWAAYRAKGTELRVNQVDVVDVDIPSNQLRGASFINVFSPRNLDYDVSVLPRPIGGGSAMPPGIETRVSWFGSPEQGLRGMNGGGRPMGFGSSGYSYGPTGRVERLEGVRIPIWSTKAFSARWFAPTSGEPIIESDLSPSGIDRLSGTVTNRLDVPLKGAMVAFNTQIYYNLGTIAPGESKQVELTVDRKLSGHLDAFLKEDEKANPYDYYNQPKFDIYALMQAILFHDSESTATNPLPSRALHDLDLTGQLLLDRPMLIAEIDRPGADLDLGSSASASKGEHTTILRVILPLKSMKSDKGKGGK
jgi:hypothetical protein